MAGDRPKILIVDDRRANLVALRKLLGRTEAEVIEANSGNEALALTLEHEFALILLDIQMPVMDGYEVAKFLRDEETTRDIPIVFLTAAYKDAQHRIKGYGAGAVDFIEKPIEDVILLSKVRIFLDLYLSRRALERANLDLRAEIAEREAAQELLSEKALELEHINREMQQFTYIVSHDLRAPLANVSGFAAEIRRALADLAPVIEALRPHLDEDQRRIVRESLDESIPEAMAFITGGIAKMDKLIGAVLKLSRLGRLQLELEDVDVQKLIQEALASLAFQIEEAKIRVVVGDLPSLVADRTALDQIFGNLLSNAVKFMDKSRPGEIHVDGDADGHHVTYRIRDTGRGMAPADIPKAFQLFGRVGKQDRPGEGMGLAYVATLVHRLEGSIDCDSEPDLGTRFVVRLPRRDLPADS